MRVPDPDRPASALARATIPAFALLLGCHGGGGAGPDEAETGFLSESLEDDGEDDGPETWGDGALRGIVTFTLYAADAVTDVDQVGFAGAWHDDEAMVEVVDDFYAAFAFQTAFPLPPQNEDEVEQNDIPAGFDWGDVDSWLTAGNAFSLTAGDAEAFACLLQIGMVGDIYPVYAASHSAMSTEECAPQPEDFIPGVDYTIVMYGGELFPTQTFLGAVETPNDFDVVSPDLSGYNDPVMQGADWHVAWEGEGTGADRLIIRVWDDLGFMFTVRANDDGEFDIPASALGELNPGPITITIAREHIERIPFAEGGVKVVTRYEQRGYFDLIAAG